MTETILVDQGSLSKKGLHRNTLQDEKARRGAEGHAIQAEQKARMRHEGGRRGACPGGGGGGPDRLCKLQPRVQTLFQKLEALKYKNIMALLVFSKYYSGCGAEKKNSKRRGHCKLA